MNDLSLIIIGAGGHARSCIDVIEQQNYYNLLGLIGDSGEIGDMHCGYPVIGTDSDLPSLAQKYPYALIAIGQLECAERRINLYNQISSWGFSFPIIISPTAYISSHAMIGCGTIVMHRATINAGAKVGNNCIINTNSLIEHDAVVGNHCHVSTGAILNGNVSIGDGSFIGSGSQIKQGVKIGKNCLVGIGVTVRHDLRDESRFLGSTKND